MKNTKRSVHSNHKKGLTLLELTVVIVVLISMITLLFVGSRVWKSGTDRSACIMNQSNVQKAMRAHANMYGSYIGDSITDLPDQLIGSGLYLAAPPTCPAGGTYTFGSDHGRDEVPPVGTIYMQCSLAADSDHIPVSYADW